MRLMTLNTWGGKLLEPLLDFIKEYSDKIDIFCFQEIHSSPLNKTIARGMNSHVLEELISILKDYEVFYLPQLKNRDIDQDTDFELSTGNAIFIKKSIKVKEKGDFYIYRSGFELIDGNYRTIPKNLQYLVFDNSQSSYLIANFHGIYFPHDKLDTEDRLEQSKIIKNFLNKRKEKILLCGDFNLVPSTKSISILEKNLNNLVKTYNVESTRSSLVTGRAKIVDYILVSPEINVKEFKTIDSSVSDHLPLYLEFT